MGIQIIAHGYLGVMKRQEMSTNDTTSKLKDILNSGNIYPPVTKEPNKVFSYWATTINGFDIGDYTISQLYSIGAITKDDILNIYANFTYVANSIQVTFNANGGTFSDGSTSKVITTTMGSIYGELESSISVLPTKSGSYFLKWTDPKNNTVNGEYEFTESVVITAQYSASQNTSIVVKDSRSKLVISGSFPKSTLGKDLYARALSNGYTPDDARKVFSKIAPGYGSYTGQAIKSIDFSVANNPMKIGWLRGSIYKAAGADVSLYTNRNLYTDTKNFSNPASWVGYSAWKKTTDSYNGLAVMQTTEWWSGLSQYIQVKKGDILTYSAYVKNISGTGTSRIYWQQNSQTEGSYSTATTDPTNNSVTITDSWQRISVTTVVTSDGYLRPRLERTDSNPNTLQIAGIKVEKGSTATPYQQAPEDINKKIRDFSATTIPVDPSTTFAVTGKATNNIALTHNPIGNDEIWTNRNLLLNSKTLSVGVGGNGVIELTKDSYDSTTNMWHITAPKGDGEYSGIFFGQPGNVSNLITKGQQWSFSFDIKGTGVYSLIGVEGSAPFNSPSGNVPKDWARVSSTGTASGTNAIVIYFDTRDVALDIYIKLPKLGIGDKATPYTPAPEDIKPGLWLNDNWLYNPYTQKWLDTPIDNADYSYSNSVISFKDYFNVQYVTGDISKVRDSVAVYVKSVVAGYGSTTDKKALYNNSYLPSDDSGITLNVEEYLGYSYIVFYNPSTGYSQKIYQQAGTPYSEFLKVLARSKFEAAGKYLKGFYMSNYWTNVKLIDSNKINSPIDIAMSGYLQPLVSSFTTVFFNANGGVFYKGTSYETEQIAIEVSKTDTYGIISGYIPEVKKRTLGLLYWALDLEHIEPAYPNVVVDQSTVFSKWSVVDNIDLYRKPREYYLIDYDTILNGWDMMSKFSLSDRDNIFVIDPTGIGTTYGDSNASTMDGWGNAKREITANTIEFDAYYNGYDQYNRLGGWISGKRLVLAMLNETGIPTYWAVELDAIERTEIKYGDDMLKGKLSFKKLSPAFDLEFIGLGTDNTLDNQDGLFRRNAYVYIHSLKIPNEDNGIQIIADNGTEVIEDSVRVDLPAGAYFEYSTIPFRETWRYGPTWSDMPNNLYNNIIDLVASKSLKLGIGKWKLNISSSTKVPISSLAPNTIAYYRGKTIDSLGGIGPFTGIAIKEKEL